MVGLRRVNSPATSISAALAVFVALALSCATAQTPAPIVPSVTVSTGPLLSPDNALNSPVFATFTSAAAQPRSERVKALARAFTPGLAGIDEIHSYVRSSIEIVPQFGLKQGASGAALHRRGTAFDAAMLMVELARELGLEARYRIGTAALTVAEVRGWFGSDDAKLVCEMLRDGGFPATVNGSTECTILSGEVSSVQIAHVWVEARTPSGTWYAFDPSKREAAASAPMLSSLINLGPSDLADLTAAGGAVGADQATNPSESGVHDVLSEAADDLHAQLDNEAHAQLSTRAMLGLAEPEPVYTHQQRLTSLPGRVPLSGRPSEWNEIPNELRTRLHIAVAGPNSTGTDMAVALEWSGDATAIGEQGLLVLDLATQNLDQETNVPLSLKTVDGTPLAPDGVVDLMGRAGTAHIVTVEVDHPYASSNGILHDRFFSRPVSLDMPAMLTIGLGASSFEAVTQIQRVKQIEAFRTRAIYPYEGGISQFPNFTTQWLQCFDTFLNSDQQYHFTIDEQGGLQIDLLFDGHYGYSPYDQCLDEAFEAPDLDQLSIFVPSHRREMIQFNGRWHASLPILADLYAGAANGRSLVHHSVGVLQIAARLSHSSSFFDEALVADIETEASFQGGATSGSRQAFALGFSLASSTLEGAIAQQITDAPVSGSPAAIYAPYARSNESNRRLYRIDNTNRSTIIPSLDNSPALIDSVAAEWTVFAPGRNRTGLLEYSVQPQPGTQAPLAVNAPVGRGAFFVAHRTAGDTISVAPLVTTHETSMVKGAAAALPEWASFRPDTAEAFQAQYDSVARLRVVSEQTGELSLSVTDLSLGAGAPFGLEFTRTYASNDASGVRPLGWGWSHNHQISAETSSDLSAALGVGSPRAAIASLVGAQATVDLFEANGVTAQTMSAALMIQNWWSERLYDNAVAITRGGASQTFHRLPNGSYVSAWGDPSRLTATGAPALCRGVGWDSMLPAGFEGSHGFQYVETYLAYDGTCPTGATTLRGSAGPLGFTLTHLDDGSVESFSLRRPSLEYGSSPDQDIFPDGASNTIVGTFRGKTAAAWPIAQRLWPGGRAVNYMYNATNGVLTSVNTTTGWSLSFAYTTAQPYNDGASGPTVPPKRVMLQSVTDNTGRTVSFGYQAGLTALTTVQNPLSQTTSYGWGGGDEHRALLSSVTLPGQSSPLVQVFYDPIWRVREVRDGEGRAHRYGGGAGVGAHIMPDGVSRDLEALDENGNPGWSRDASGVLIRTRSNIFGAALETQVGDAATGHAVERRGYAYDALGRTTSEELRTRTDPAAGSFFVAAPFATQRAYENATWPYAVTRITDPRSKVTTIQYHATFGKPTRSDGPMGEVDEIIYGTSGNAIGLPTEQRIKVSGTETRVTQFGWNGLGQLTSVTQVNPGGANIVSSATYDVRGDVRTLTNGEGDVNRVERDALRRVTLMVVGDNDPARRATTAFVYETPRGWLQKAREAVSESGGVVNVWRDTQFSWHDDGQLDKRTNPDGSFVEHAYDTNGRLHRVYDEERRITATLYEPNGRPSIVIRGEGSAAENRQLTQYFAHGPVRLYRPGRGVEAGNSSYDTTFNLDAYGRINATFYPDGSREWLSYDGAGNLVTRRQRLFASVASDPWATPPVRAFRYIYDASNRLDFEFGPGGVVIDYAYDLTGAKKSAARTNDNAVAAWGYDFAGRLSSETRTWPNGGPVRTVTYGYDRAGRRTSITWPEDSWSAVYDYDALGRLESVSHAGAPLAAYAYDRLGRRTNVAFGANVATAATTFIPNRNEPDTHTLSWSGGSATFDYGYDFSGRLTSESVNNAAFRYAPQNPQNGTAAYPVNVADQLTAAAGASTSYDSEGRGNLTGHGPRTYSYDAYNRLIGASGGGVSAVYAFDPDGRRMRAEENGVATLFLHALDQEIADYDGSGTLLRRYVPGAGVDERAAQVSAAGVASYPLTNRLGGVVAEIGSGGPLTSAWAYGPFGTMNGPTTGHPFRFTGQRIDLATGLFHYKARAYDPALGRFLQTDPIGYEAGLNLYAYVGNDPLNHTDPTGNDAVFCVVRPGPNGSMVGSCQIVRQEPGFLHNYTNITFRTPTGTYRETIRPRVDDDALAAIVSRISAQQGYPGVFVPITPRTPFTTEGEARAAAGQRGWIDTGRVSRRGTRIYRDPNTGHYYTRDLPRRSTGTTDRGGVWKRASSPERLESQQTRDGTYDRNVNRIGD